jgi:dinuclear metal center YbgI/SA1388 family protein
MPPSPRTKPAYTVRDICAVMEAWAPPGAAYDWDRVGLQVGSKSAPVRRVLTCLTVNDGAVAAAKKARAEMIVAHHPVVWDPLKTLCLDSAQARPALELFRADIACFVAHTNLDVVPGGVNHVLAAALGLSGLRPLVRPPQAAQVKVVTFVPESHLAAVREAVCAVGAGEIGAYTQCSFSAPGVGTFLPGTESQPHSGAKGRVNAEPEHRLEVLAPKARLGAVIEALRAAHPYETPAYDIVLLENRDESLSLGLRGELPKALRLDAFARQVCQALDVPHVRWVGEASRKVRQVAVLGGSGAGEIAKLPAEVDVYVTGDVKYHDADLAAARGLALVDPGHAGSEKAIATAIAVRLRASLKGLLVTAYIEPELFHVAHSHG